MQRKLIGVVAALAAALLAGSALGADSPPQTAARATLATSGAEYIVAYDAADGAAAEQAITAAGGTVVDRNDAVDLVLVNSDNAAFAQQVRSGQGVTGVALNHSIGTTRQGMPHRFAEERPAVAAGTTAGSGHKGGGKHGQRSDPLTSLQWDMDMIGAEDAHRKATGKGVTVAVIDTGVDASHPDIAPNFSNELSRNFVVDRPDIDGPCDTPSCVDPANVDEGGHGTHVAGIIAAARNGVGITGVAPDATIVNVRAGQDSGYFFVWETVKALTYAGDARLDVANMSFYTDPWLFNCSSTGDYVSGTVSDEEIAEQATIRKVVLAATRYAHKRGVTLVAAAGNGATNYSLPTRLDDTSPDYPPGTERERVVTSNCLDLPSEAPDVISISSVGPSTIKSDFSNYGLGSVEVSAPGGWFRDGVGTPTFQTPGNLILSSYPLALGIEEELFDPVTQQPTDDFSVADCSVSPCGFYTYLQGTSMASPHAAGVAALIVEAHGKGDRHHGYSLDPDKVRSILLRTATDHACPAGGTEIYTDEGRPVEYNAVCDGTTSNNGLYGEGIVNAAAAVRR